ncbi:MAG: response regulator, partial [Verrucomicrobiota bacterium]
MSQKLRILIVEDNHVDIRFVNEALKQAGPMNFQIEPVGQLSEALTRLERKGIDLVILDLGLPDSQGMATFRTLRQAAPGIPVIVLTGNDDQDLAIAAVRDGAQDYLIKGQIGGKPLIRAVRYALA